MSLAKRARAFFGGDNNENTTITSRRDAAEKIARTFPELLLEAENLANMLAGMKSSASAGHSPDFLEYRPFENGIDNPRDIDWAASERNPNPDGTPGYLIRVREKEMPNTLYVGLDRTAVNNYQSEKAQYSKLMACDLIALTLFFLAGHSKEQIALLGSPEGLSEGKNAVDKAAAIMRDENWRFGGPAVHGSGNHNGEPLYENSDVFLIGDFTEMTVDETRNAIEEIRRTGAHGFVIQVLDPQQVDFAFEGHNDFVSMTGGGTHKLEKAEDLVSRYQNAFIEHQKALSDAIDGLPGWALITYVTDQPIIEALQPIYDPSLMINGNLRAQPKPKIEPA